MNSSAEYTPVVKGEIVCRPTSWTDVIKFFAFNYGLHVLTIVSAPGSGTVTNAVGAAIALLLPFSGICTALEIINRFTWSKSDDLHTAQSAGALCMVMPWSSDVIHSTV